MTCYAVGKDGKKTEVSTFSIEVAATDRLLHVYTSLTPLNSVAKFTDTSIADINTFKPVYRSSFNFFK